MHLNDLDFLFWMAGLAGHLAVLFVLVWRKRVAQYPIFTSFIATNALRTLALSIVFRVGSAAQYFEVYWLLAVLDSVLQAGVVYELASGAFRPLRGWVRDVRLTLIAYAIMSLVIAASLTLLSAPPTKRWVDSLVIKGNFFSEVCISELFVGILYLSVTSGLPMKTHAIRISQGFGVYSIIDVGIEAGHSYFGVSGNSHSYIALSHFRMLAYLGSLCFWIATLWRDEEPARHLTDEMRSQLTDLQRWVRASSDEPRSREGPRV